MFVFGSNAAGGYNLTDSVRFRQSASAYLTRTPSTSTSRTKWTFSCWLKRGSLVEVGIFGAAVDANNKTYIRLNSNQIDLRNVVSGTGYANFTTAVFNK